MSLRRSANEASTHAMECEEEMASAQHDLGDYRSQHPNEAAATAVEIVRYVAIGLGIPAVMCVDFLMLSAASEYLAMSLSGLSATFAAAAKVAFSIVIVILEVSIALRLHADELEEKW